MTSDAGDTTGIRSKIQIVGGLVDYLYTSVKYLMRRTLVRAETWLALSPTILAFFTLLVGLLSNVKFVTWTLYYEPLHAYFRVMQFRLGVPDCVLIFFNCLLIWQMDTIYYIEGTSYFCMPWLVASLRGLLHQVPTAYAILQASADAYGKFNTQILKSFSLFFLMEVDLWLILYLLFSLRSHYRHFLLRLYYRGPEAWNTYWRTI